MLNIRQHHLLMVNMGTPESHVAIISPNRLTLNAAYLDARTGEKIADTCLHLNGPIELHLMASRIFPGWYYIVQWDRLEKQYHCTCFEARTVGYCEHLETFAPAVIVA